MYSYILPSEDQLTTPTTAPHQTTKEPSLEELLGKVKPTNSPTTRSFLLDVLGKIQSATLPVPTKSNRLCSQGLKINNVILNGGMGSGEVAQYKNVSDIDACAAKCCHSRGCNVAFVIHDVCYTIKCYSRDLCRTRPLEQKTFTSKVVYISRNGMSMFSSANEAKVGGSTSDILSTAQPISVFASKTNSIPGAEGSQNATKKSELRCEAGNYFLNVRLRGDLGAGVFTERGKVTSMVQCSRFCCDDESCDLAYLLESVCYSVRCHSEELCQVVTSSPLAVNPTVAYAIRYNSNGTIHSKSLFTFLKKLSSTASIIHWLSNYLFFNVLEKPSGSDEVVTPPSYGTPTATTPVSTVARTQQPTSKTMDNQENHHKHNHHAEGIESIMANHINKIYVKFKDV